MFNFLSPQACILRSLRVFARLQKSLLRQIERCNEQYRKSQEQAARAYDRREDAIERARQRHLTTTAKIRETQAALDRGRAEARRIHEHLANFVPNL